MWRFVFLSVFLMASLPAGAQTCGNEGETACPIWVHFPSCRSPELKEVSGRCIHPDCGRNGQAACLVTVRIPSCDNGLIEYAGRCFVRNECGEEGQRACTVAESFPSCHRNVLVESAGRCIHPDCGRQGQSACPVTTRIPSCDDTLVEFQGRCTTPTCGGEGDRPCQVFERIPSCDAGLIERPFGERCIHPDCGRNGQIACSIVERIPSCDAGLVEEAGHCVNKNICASTLAQVPVVPVADPPPRIRLLPGDRGGRPGSPQPPGNLQAERIDVSTIKLNWDAVAGSQYRIWRDQTVIANTVDGTEWIDRGLSPGQHVYFVQSLRQRLPSRNGLSSPSPAVRIRTGSFNVVVIGDSVTWGQGLADANKYSTQVKSWLETNLGAPVNLVFPAHSGADILPPQGSDPSAENRMTPGEIPNSFPTITHQIELARSAFGSPGDVDLVIAGGCINDIGAAKILLDPRQSGQSIQNLGGGTCRDSTKTLLDRAHQAFPNAFLVLTGYYPIISRQSDLTAVGILLGSTGVAAAIGTSTLGAPILDPVTGAIIGISLTEAAKQLTASNSAIFYFSSSIALAASTRDFVSQGGKGAFACIPFTDANAYAAPQSWLWVAPTGPFYHDEVYDLRAQQCADPANLAASGVSPIQCPLSSMGHPNVAGSRAYFDAIRSQIQPYLSIWQSRMASKRTSN